jgi:hypothetical protein
MYKRFFLLLCLMALVVLLASCGPDAKSAPANLAFEAPMNVDSSQRFHASLGVRNVGETRFREYTSFNGMMVLHDVSDEEVGRIQVTTLWELAPGNAGWPAAYASKLPAGAYQLTWGAPDYGSVTVDFTIVELDGWLYLGEQSIQSTAADAPEDEREYGSLQSLADLARVNLAQRLAVEPENVTVQGVEEAEFPDASLGVPEPGQMYAQVLTPGYTIELSVNGQSYEYHASDERLVFAAQEDGAPLDSITIEDLQVTSGKQIVVRGQSTLPERTCLGSELWADGELQPWWPVEACTPVENGAWQIVVQLGSGQVPPELDSSVQYMLRVFQQNGPDIVAVFAFDLAGPPESFTKPPTLIVEEQAIVDAEVDGPGHLEYNDRLGEETLARMEGLRARASELRVERNNTALAPFGYRIEARFDAESNQDLYDLFREGKAKPVASGLSYLWPVSVNASGTDFLLVVEKALAANLYQVQSDGVETWDDAADSNWLPPGYVGDALAQLTFTDFPTLTYQVALDQRPVYTGTAVAMGAYMPLRSFTTWDDHWVLDVDDHLIMDGQDLGETLGYDAAFGFSLIRGEPFYFFEQAGQVRISYGGQTLPNAYDYVVHNQCCEAAMHNPLVLGDAVLFHARWNGTWYFVEAGVYDGEMSGTYRYTAPEGWAFRYPMHWSRLDEELGFVQDPATGKTVTFASELTMQDGLESWLESEIARKLAATEAKNTLAEPLTSGEEGVLTIYRYAILSKMDGSETLLRTTVFFDGQRRYEFHAAIPQLSEDEYQAVIGSFVPVPGSRRVSG